MMQRVGCKALPTGLLANVSASEHDAGVQFPLVPSIFLGIPACHVYATYTPTTLHASEPTNLFLTRKDPPTFHGRKNIADENRIRAHMYLHKRPLHLDRLRRRCASVAESQRTKALSGTSDGALALRFEGDHPGIDHG